MTEISIIAATVYGNRGAEAMLSTVVGRLRELLPAAHFHVFSYYPGEDRALVDNPAVSVHSATPLYLLSVLAPLSGLLALFRRSGLGRLQRLFPASVRALGESRVLIDLAGVSFIDGREVFLPYNTLTLWPAMLLGVPVVKYAQAIGPVTSIMNRAAARLTLPRCRRIFARGSETRTNLKRFGELPVEDAADVAFLYRSGYSLSDERPRELGQLLCDLERPSEINGGAPVVGICPSSVVAARSRKAGLDYEGLIAGLVTGLMQRGIRVVLFPNATRSRADTALRNNDIPVIRAIAARLGPRSTSALSVVTEDVNTRSIRELVSRMDVVLTSRFHAMVAALSLGIPTGVIGWSHKYLEVMQAFGQDHRVWDWRTGSVETALEGVSQLLADRGEVSERIMGALPRVQASAERQIQYVADLVSHG